MEKGDGFVDLSDKLFNSVNTFNTFRKFHRFLATNILKLIRLLDNFVYPIHFRHEMINSNYLNAKFDATSFILFSIDPVIFDQFPITFSFTSIVKTLQYESISFVSLILISNLIDDDQFDPIAPDFDVLLTNRDIIVKFEKAQ